MEGKDNYYYIITKEAYNYLLNEVEDVESKFQTTFIQYSRVETIQCFSTWQFENVEAYFKKSNTL